MPSNVQVLVRGKKAQHANHLTLAPQPVLHKYDFKDALGASLKWLIEGQQLSCDASAEAWVL
eukprot:scaffold275565_cov15-Tisochrysis_lutea.AAC.1